MDVLEETYLGQLYAEAMLNNISKRSKLPLALLTITAAPFPICG